jgi:hypothetical protein
VDIALLHDGAKRSTNKGGPGDDEELVLEATAGTTVLVGVERRMPRGNVKDADVGGFDSPYELRATVEDKTAKAP